MAIAESQLETWSKQGSVTQSQTTYATVRRCLEAPEAPYAKRSTSIFLQGSYGNDTNVYADSDVDLVIATDSIYYDDTSALTDADSAAYKSAFVSGGYSYDTFKKEVTDHLRNRFGDAVKPGKKAIFIRGDGTRRDTDVLPAVEHRHYWRFRSASDNNYAKGIVFWTSDGVKIVNYPKQHSANLTTKHQQSGGWLKPTVRVLKNMRNHMIQKRILQDGIAPSYFLEGMLYNVPNANFGLSYQRTVANALNWIDNAKWDELICANEQYLLLHPTSPVTWRAENLRSYLTATIGFWNAGAT
jgi:hypothetical protein